jgi:molybdate transport system substrate-binding protein
MREKVPAVLVGLTALALAACGSGSSAGSSGATGSTGSTGSVAASAGTALGGSITVLAAASLKEPFTAIGKAFRAANPGTTVNLNFGASSALAQQIVQGAPADVFASASQKNMQQVVDGEAANGAIAFARNTLEIAVPPDNPARIAALADLGRPAVKVVLCQPQVPCGALAQTVLGKAKVTVRPVSLEADVTSTLTKVELGEADAALVYVTDVTSAGSKVEGIEIPAGVNASTTYPIAALSGSTNADLAKAFVAYVLSGQGRAELTKAGFQAP